MAVPTREATMTKALGLDVFMFCAAFAFVGAVLFGAF
jgi:hypothetical protein